jgi:hypothetical protein
MAAAAAPSTAVPARRPGRLLVTVKDAARALGVSERHVQRLVQEADVDRRSRWRFGREIIDMTPKGSARRTLRINLALVVPGLTP